MKNLPATVAWLYDWTSGGRRLGSALEVLLIDHLYPGLLADLDKLVWYVELIKEQNKGNKSEDLNG